MQISGQNARLHAKKFQILPSEALTSDLRLPISGILELTRYIHLNPLRARLAEDLKSLDKYQWAGHSVLIGKQKNPLVPEIPPAIEEDNYLAEKTVEDVLKHFGQNLTEARQRYRKFIEI